MNFVPKGKYYGKVDFVQYYSASKLISSNLNPYLKKNLENIQDKIDNKYDYIYMYNPPQIFLIIYGLSFFDFESSAKIWRFFSVLLIVLSFKLLLTTFKLRNKLSCYFLLLFFVLFEPIFSILYYGQISFILLFAISSCFYFINFAKKKDNTNYIYLSGFALGLITIKPHILILLLPLFLLGFSKEEFFKLLTGFFVCAFFLFFSSELIFPGINISYLNFIKAPPIFWKNPTLGSWVQQFLGIHSVFVRFIPTFLVLFLIIIFKLLIIFKNENIKNKDSLNSIMAFYPLCLIACPYFWIFDYIMLLPVIIYLASKITNFKPIKELVFYLFILALCFYSFLRDKSLGQQYYIYFPLIISIFSFYFSYFISDKNKATVKYRE